jgi:hypothetical protein
MYCFNGDGLAFALQTSSRCRHVIKCGRFHNMRILLPKINMIRKQGRLTQYRAVADATDAQ